MISAYYLCSLRLQNVRLFEDVTLPFTHEGRPRMWTCLLADNGCGKTTALQAIALATNGETVARALVDDAAEMVRVGAPVPGMFGRVGRSRLEARVIARFRGTNPQGAPQDVSLNVPPGTHEWVGESAPGVPANGLPFGAGFIQMLRRQREAGFLVLGLGVGRRASRRGQVAVPSDPIGDRVSSLFRPEHRHLGLTFGQAFDELDQRRSFHHLLNLAVSYCTSDGTKLLPDVNGVVEMDDEARQLQVWLDQGGYKLELEAHHLSQGYQSVLSVICEIIGQHLLEAPSHLWTSLDQIAGIALIDELDLHLHPTWQRRIVPMLRALFPNVQFVVTTHSPLVLAGFEAHEILRLRRVDDHLELAAPSPLEPGMQSASEILTTWFDTAHAARPDLLAKRRALLAELARPDGDRDAVLVDALQAELAPYRHSIARESAGPRPDLSVLRALLDEDGS